MTPRIPANPARNGADAAWSRARDAEAQLVAQRAALSAIERQRRALSDLLDKASLDSDEREILVALTQDPKSRSIFRNPKIRAQRLKSMRETLQYFWGPLLHKLTLNPAQTERFEGNLLEREEGLMDLQALVEAGKITEAERDSLMSNVGAGVQEGMHALLTPAQLQEYDGYNHVKFVSSWMEDLAIDSYATTTPLTADQADGLVKILADPSNHDPSSHTPPGQAAAFIHYDDALWDRLMPQVSVILSPQQYADFDQMRQSAVAAAGITRLTNQLSTTLGAH